MERGYQQCQDSHGTRMAATVSCRPVACSGCSQPSLWEGDTCLLLLCKLYRYSSRPGVKQESSCKDENPPSLSFPACLCLPSSCLPLPHNASSSYVLPIHVDCQPAENQHKTSASTVAIDGLSLVLTWHWRSQRCLSVHLWNPVTTMPLWWTLRIGLWALPWTHYMAYISFSLLNLSWNMRLIMLTL